MTEDTGYFEAAARYVPNLLNLLPQWGQYKGATAADPVVLGAHLSSGTPAARGGHQALLDRQRAVRGPDHVLNARVHALPGAGHAAPLTRPQTLAEALTEFFARAQKPA